MTHIVRFVWITYYLSYEFLYIICSKVSQQRVLWWGWNNIHKRRTEMYSTGKQRTETCKQRTGESKQRNETCKQKNEIHLCFSYNLITTLQLKLISIIVINQFLYHYQIFFHQVITVFLKCLIFLNLS